MVAAVGRNQLAALGLARVLPVVKPLFQGLRDGFALADFVLLSPFNLDRVASGELPTEYIGKRNMIVYELNHGTVLLTEGFHFTIED